MKLGQCATIIDIQGFMDQTPPPDVDGEDVVALCSKTTLFKGHRDLAYSLMSTPTSTGRTLGQRFGASISNIAARDWNAEVCLANLRYLFEDVMQGKYSSKRDVRMFRAVVVDLQLGKPIQDQLLAKIDPDSHVFTELSTFFKDEPHSDDDSEEDSDDSEDDDDEDDEDDDEDDDDEDDDEEDEDEDEDEAVFSSVNQALDVLRKRRKC